MLRILFVSSTSTGGSGFAQREFAQGLASRGHAVDVLYAKSGRQFRRELYKYVRTAARHQRGARIIGGFLGWAATRIGARPRRTTLDGLECWASAVPENTYRWLSRRQALPDVVVTHSLHPRSWAEIHDALGHDGIPCAYFVHEAVALEHLRSSGRLPDRILAGARTYVAQAAELGLHADHVPRVAETGPTMTETSREVALLINPVPTHGVEVLWRLAEARPDVRFVLQESWDLTDEQLARIQRRLQGCRNVELRRRQERRDLIYRDAKVLIAPHMLDNNPRVVVEAHANGIPVLASDFPGLQEVVADGGVLVARDAPSAEWEAAFSSIWDDASTYAVLVERSYEHSAHPESDPRAAVERLEAALVELADRGPHAGRARL